MPNHIYGNKPKKRAQLAIAALQAMSDLSNFITRIDGGQFVGALGDRVYHQLEAVTRARDYEWRTRNAPIVMDEIFTQEISILLNEHTYSGNKFTDEEERMDLESYAREILAPQVRAVTRRLNAKILPALKAAPFKVTNLNAAAADDPFDWALGAQATLDAQGTPADGRVLLVGANAFRWLVKSDALLKYDAEQARTVFRRGAFGEIADFQVAKHASLGPNDIFAIHRSWAVMANVAPVVPSGAAWGERVQAGGYGLRVIRDYDPNFLSDRSVVSTFTGISSINDELERHTESSAAAANSAGDSALVGDPVIDFTAKTLKTTGKNVRGAKGTFTPSGS